MLDYLIPEDEVDNDTDYQNKIRKQIDRPIQTADDTEYSPEEIRTAIEALDSKKVTGENGTASEILQRAYRPFPKHIYTLYNQCLRQGCFPKLWKTVNVILITKPGNESTSDPSNYRQISIINDGGKVLEKLLFNKTIHIYKRSPEPQSIRFHPKEKHNQRGNGSKGVRIRGAATRINYNSC